MWRARDLASWAVRLLERGGHGIFNAAGESLPLAAYLDVARRVAGHTGPLVADGLAWAVRTEVPTVTGAGLDDAEESALLAVLDRP